ITSPPAETPPLPAPGVPFQPQREVRFAVVMYGGVSLAIYINGVAQELLNMVRATATLPTEASEDKDDQEWEPLIKDKSQLSGAMGVYRKLGQYLGVSKENGRDESLRQKTISEAAPIKTRIVVDVISGT